MTQNRCERAAGVENVVDHSTSRPRTSGNSSAWMANSPGAGRLAAITAGLNQSDLQGQIDLANQIGQQHHAAGQHADHDRRTAGVIVRDAAGQARDSLANRCGG